MFSGGIEVENWLKMVKHVTDSLVDLFDSRQLHISYTKHVELFFKVLDQGKLLSLFALWGYNEGV